ncbi:ABC transporter permease [Virgibacillus profundi]|uniref:Putative hemin transport system permease protein HrtB n=1 Tax=Virgibacillus profundi TaxID=2024555 RepID=A0A2A2I985_9BACI|nr:ABC transporter permease [Virgibacillus profundi]PAV28197.1 ABC transporter permease [Virgibacillus profundi]PXY52502.1 ABC transporter permease [Virgibacillus profundi]
MFLAIRELTHAKFRYVLIGLIMVLIASLIFIISGLTKGLSADNASAIQNLQADYVLMEPDAELEITKSFIPHKKLDDIAKIDGVEEANPLSIRMMNASVNGTQQNEDVALFVTEADGVLLPSVSEGKTIANENEVIADSSLKREGIEIGDTLQFGEESEFTIVGFTDNQRYSHTSVLFMDNGQRDNINAITIQAEEGKIDAIKSTIGDSLDIVTTEEALQGIPSYSQEQASLNMMIIFLFVIAAFVLAAFFYVITLQKRDQFGVLKALGAKTIYLVKNLIGQVVLLSVICIAVGVGLTLGIKALLPEDMPFLLETSGMIQTSLLILAVSVVGALVSLVQVVKIDPIEAIEGAGK